MTKKQNLEREVTILVTGATGTVGSEVVKQLGSLLSSSNRNVIIKAAIHSQNKADKFKQHNKTVETVITDYNNSESIVNALNQVDKLFLLTLPTHNSTDIYTNLVKEFMKSSSSINHVVKLSSMAVEIGLENVIGRLHKEEEKIIEESGIPFTFLRPSAFMQNFVNYFS